MNDAAAGWPLVQIIWRTAADAIELALLLYVAARVSALSPHRIEFVDGKRDKKAGGRKGKGG